MVPLCLVPALVLLFFYVSTFRSMCAVPNMAVFCSSLTSWFTGMSLTYFLNDLEIIIIITTTTTTTTTTTYVTVLLYWKCQGAEFLFYLAHVCRSLRYPLDIVGCRLSWPR